MFKIGKLLQFKSRFISVEINKKKVFFSNMNIEKSQILTKAETQSDAKFIIVLRKFGFSTLAIVRPYNTDTYLPRGFYDLHSLTFKNKQIETIFSFGCNINRCFKAIF